MNIETMKRTTRSQLREGDRPWGGRLWENCQPMNKNLIRGRRNGTSWHNTANFPHSVPEVNEAVGWWRFQCLPGEISIARGRESGSAVRSNALGDDREVSRGHITEEMNRGAGRCPSKQRNSQAYLRKDRTGSMIRPVHPSTAMNPHGGARNGDGPQAEKERSCDSVAVPKGEAAHVRYSSE